MFDGIENRIAQIAFGIPAVKGVEFGMGFAVAAMRGSENNDPYRIDAETGKIEVESNTPAASWAVFRPARPSCGVWP